MTDFPKNESKGGKGRTERDDDLLALFLAAAPDRDDGAKTVPDDLFARILADADAVQRGFSAPVSAATVPAAARGGLLATLLGVLGGWPAVGGLASAGVAGVWLGFAPPTAVSTVASDYLGIDYLGAAGAVDLELVPGFSEYGLAESELTDG